MIQSYKTFVASRFLNLDLLVKLNDQFSYFHPFFMYRIAIMHVKDMQDLIQKSTCNKFLGLVLCLQFDNNSDPNRHMPF